MKIKQFDWFILIMNTKIERRKFRSKRLSLERVIKFVTASDEFSEIKSSEPVNSNYLDVPEENLGRNVKSSLEIDTSQVCLHFYVLHFC